VEWIEHRDLSSRGVRTSAMTRAEIEVITVKQLTLT
jgi:hypothetical protein